MSRSFKRLTKDVQTWVRFVIYNTFRELKLYNNYNALG